MPAKKALLHYLAEDDLQKVIESLFPLAVRYKDKQLLNNATIQSARLKNIEKQTINGALSHEEEQKQFAKIRVALLTIVQGLPDNWIIDETKSSPVAFEVSPKMLWKKYAVYVAALVVFIAGIVALNLINIFKKSDTTKTPIEIRLPDPNLSTSGDNSPAIITNSGDVTINYGEPVPQKDSTITTKTTPK